MAGRDRHSTAELRDKTKEGFYIMDRKNIETYANNISGDIDDDNQTRECRDAGATGPNT